MKNQTRRIKPIFSTVLLLLLVALTVTACTKQPKIEQPDEALLEQVKKDYNYHHCKLLEDYDPQASVTVDKCYGVYNGCVAVMLTADGISYHCAEWDGHVANVTFHYWDGRSIEIWKDGKIYTLQEAYDQSFLSKQDIKTIAKLHNVWYKR